MAESGCDVEKWLAVWKHVVSYSMLGRHDGHGGVSVGGDRGHGDPQRLSDGGLPRCSSTPITRTAWPSWWCYRAAACKSTAFQQFISFNNTSGLANMAVEQNIGAATTGRHLRRRLRQSERPGTEEGRVIPEEAQLRLHRRRQGADRLRGPGESSWLSTTRSSQSCCGAVKKLQKRVEALEKRRRLGLRKMAEEEGHRAVHRWSLKGKYPAVQVDPAHLARAVCMTASHADESSGLIFRS